MASIARLGVLEFQPTRPARGATRSPPVGGRASWSFNPRAPRGARQRTHERVIAEYPFQPTRPARGATLMERVVPYTEVWFQPTRPARGATVSSAT